MYHSLNLIVEVDWRNGRLVAHRRFKKRNNHLITREIYFIDVQSTHVNFKYDPRNNEFTCNYSSIYRFILQLFLSTSFCSLTDKNQTDHVYSILTVTVEIHNEQSMLIIKLQYAIRRLCCIARKYITAGNDSRYCAYQ